jgi:small subunit ribosomal protein S5
MMREKNSRYQRTKVKEEFESKVLDLSRVSRMTGGGRRFKFRAIVVVGDQKSRVGLGIAKGADVAQAVEKATRAAKRNLIEVPIVNETIPHQSEAKFCAARILLKPQSKGRGLVAGGTVRVICSLAGIKNISSKVLSRTMNKLTNAMATIEALKNLRISK